ncbi:hypothetical protein ISE00_23975 [Pseudomonas aeruginosa]|uniref:hypothetical protein n=1 Tax=Pseudomonas aeruginosa TaxID=287 RepID=UPI001A25FD2D|nr:hypothetical protein [Pseudomonas aeruginosa]MBG6730522.1 hypothetical protein [Pseudomonas aeruginosa]MBV5724736.1 hypothetical protein [Pseudomonas aeruginosa]MBX5749211.1 hypothetical protein [Pseudomonas aeruginosa]MCT5435581.1 hypothetical protein [Pseudomonas aeruginosa]MDI2408627.1 hypothetical protein [Pseudomonas aeruginosa]
MVGGFCVVSREVIKVALRDERRYLRALGQEGEEGEEEAATLYPDGFSVEASQLKLNMLVMDVPALVEKPKETLKKTS